MIVVDGGRGELRCTVKSLSSLDLGKPCFSLADSNEEIYSTRKYPLILFSNDEGLKIVRYVRDETHRLA
jgi:excinuclease UvrABC nuclease subunit